MPWVYVPELLPLNARTKGTAIGISSNWLCNFTVAMITPIIINRLGWKAYLIFTVTNAVFLPMVYFLYRKLRPFCRDLRLHSTEQPARYECGTC